MTEEEKKETINLLEKETEKILNSFFENLEKMKDLPHSTIIEVCIATELAKHKILIDQIIKILGCNKKIQNTTENE